MNDDLPTTLRSIAKRVQWEDELNAAADAYEKVKLSLDLERGRRNTMQDLFFEYKEMYKEIKEKYDKLIESQCE